MATQLTSTGRVQGIHMAAATPSQVSVQSAFYSALQAQANQSVGSIFGVEIAPVSQAAVGGFNYIWQNPSLAFNLGTFNYINGRVAPSVSPSVKITDPFGTDWDNILRRITFGYSNADQARINAAQTAANAQATAVVSQYSGTFTQITPEMMQKANVTTPIDYIILYVVAQQWSGTSLAKTPPLSLMAMQQARDLRALLPSMPPAGQNMLGSITKYLNALSTVLPLQQLENNALWMLQQLIDNTEQPSTTNGGVTTVDPNGGASSTHVGYTIPAAVTSIQNDLANTGRELSISMTATQVDQNTASVNVGAGAGGSVPLDWFLTLSGSASAQQNIFSFQGSGSSVSIIMRFQGYSYIPVSPNSFQADTVTGWFSAQVLSQAVKNSGQDVTGYKFVNNPGYDFGVGGDFGLLTGLLVSNFPTVSITYHAGNFSQFQQSFQEQSSFGLNFFGIPIASFSQSVYNASLQQESQQGSFTVTFAPSQEVLTVPDLQKQAYVIGASVTYPGSGQ